MLSNEKNPGPVSTMVIDIVQYSKAVSFTSKGSGACRMNAATLMVMKTKNAANLVPNPKTTSIPPKNSNNAADQAKNSGEGNPNFATPSVNCSILPLNIFP